MAIRNRGASTFRKKIRLHRILEMKKISVGFIIGRETQHKYFAKILSQVFRINFVISMHSGLSDIDLWKKAITIDDENLMPLLESHVLLRKKYAEEYLLPAGDEFPETYVHNISNSEELHSKDCIELISLKKPDILILYGAPVVKEQIIRLFNNTSIINIHNGLADFYRGGVANLMAFYEHNYKQAGLTVHSVVDKIDGGKIIKTLKAEYEKDDDPQKVAIRLVKKAPDLVIEGINDIFSNKQFPAYGKGKLNKMKEFKLSFLKDIYDSFEKGLHMID